MLRKYTPEEIERICKEYLLGQKGASEICIDNGLSKGKPPGMFWRWISQYRAHGIDAFISPPSPRQAFIFGWLQNDGRRRISSSNGMMILFAINSTLARFWIYMIVQSLLM